MTEPTIHSREILNEKLAAFEVSETTREYLLKLSGKTISGFNLGRAVRMILQRSLSDQYGQTDEESIVFGMKVFNLVPDLLRSLTDDEMTWFLARVYFLDKGDAELASTISFFHHLYFRKELSQESLQELREQIIKQRNF